MEMACSRTADTQIVCPEPGLSQPMVLASGTHVFEIMKLALELRLMIYRFVFNYESLERYFKWYTSLVLSSPRTSGSRRVPKVRKTCPGLLLVNKEIYRESVAELWSRPLRFSHGILKANLCDVISTDLLRHITHLEITDAGVDLTAPPLAVTFHGVQYLFKQLADVFENGHSLRQLTFTVKAADFNTHMRQCADNPFVTCGIKAFMSSLKQSIGRIRGIKKVVFNGDMSNAWKTLMIKNMTAAPKNIFKLPLKVRQRIYKYAADPNTATVDAFETFMRRSANDDNDGEFISSSYPEFRCPTVLLINRQIHDESLAVIVATPLTISGRIPSAAHPPDIQDFIAIPLLSKMQHLVLDFHGWQYLSIIPSLCAVAKPGSGGLQTLRLRIFDAETRTKIMHSGGHYPDQQLHDLIRPLHQLRGMKNVTFEGDLPKCYTRPLFRTMLSKAGGVAEALQGERWDGKVFLSGGILRGQ